MIHPPITLKQRLKHAVTMLLVSGLSLFLLIYVGFGEAQRNYQHFVIERLTAQGKIVQNAMNTFLRAGLPVKQFVGFNTLAEPIMMSDSTIAALVAVDRNGKRVFATGNKEIPILAGNWNRGSDGVALHESDRYFQIVLPLRNKFETVGHLAVTIPRGVVSERLAESFEWLLYIAGALALAFALFTSAIAPSLSARRTPLVQIVYAVTFIAMAGVVISTLVTLYSEGAQTKTKALADSLGHRLTDIVAFNLNIDEFEGLDRTLGEYRRLNPDISAAALIVNGAVLIHTDRAAVGKPWVRPPRTYEYVYDLTRPEISANKVHVAVALPIGIIYERVARTVKNFAALFIATAFLAGLFLQIAGAVRTAQVGASARTAAGSGDHDALGLVKPVFFLAVFAEHLTYSFLPQFMRTVTTESGLTDDYASALFMTYYLFFALTLIPAGRYAQKHGPPRLMYGGLALTGLGLLCLILPVSTYVSGATGGIGAIDYFTVMAARTVSGIGQAMLFIGVQSYILDMASPHKRTQGAAIIVFGFQGGMISGTAIGSLLVVYMGAESVFALGAVIAFCMALYALTVLPAVSPMTASDRVRLGSQKIWGDLKQVLRSFEFIKTMILVGIPAKAVMTGVILFALPLLLSDMAYAQEDIGQIIMIYAAGVLVASLYVPRYVDRTGKTRLTLFWGTAVSGLGLLMIGLIGWEPLRYFENATTFVVITGVLVVGVAHGFICAPVVTHVVDSPLSEKLGAASVTATYRFLERIGHIAGPMIVGYLFIFGGQNSQVVTWIGLIIVVFAVLFLVRFGMADAEQPAQREAMS